MQQNSFVRFEQYGIVFLLVLSMVLSLSGTAFAFKAPDETQSMTMIEEQIHPAGLKTVRVGNHGKTASGEPEFAAIDSVASLMKEAGSTAVTMSTKHDKLGFKHVRLAQHYKGLPVVGAELIVHINKDDIIYLVQGDYLPSINVSTDPAISPADAMRMGLEEHAGKSGLRVTEEPSLVIYGQRLAYRYVLSHEGREVGQWCYYVDAHTGELIHRFNNIKYAAPTGNGSAQNVTGTRLSGEDGSTVTFSGWKETTGNYYLYSYSQAWGVYDEDAYDWEQQASNNWGTSDRAAISLGNNLSFTQNWVSTVLGRNSFNNAGAFARGNAHTSTNYVNAYWDGADFHFGDGDGVSANALTTLDIASHEYGHAVTQYTSNLNYSYESGALNESYSDIMGALVEFAAQPDGRASYPSKTAGAADWLMGEDAWLSDVALRDMRDPQRYQQPSYYKGTNWYTGSGDNGGVHYNSGVQNFAFYLLAEGGAGTNDGHSYNIVGLGITAAGEIAMRANTVYLRSTSQYADARTAWVQAASDLGYSTTTVEDVWTAVGVGGSSSCTLTRTITPPTVTSVPQGGTLAPIKIIETNNCSTTLQYTEQTYLVRPSGLTSWFPQVSASLAAGQTRTVYRIFRIPTTFATGNYSWGTVAKDLSGNQLDNDSFTFTVTTAQ